MTKYEIDVGEEFPLGARLAREFERRASGFMGRVFIGGLIFICLAAIAVSHPVAMLATLAMLFIFAKAHRHHHMHHRHRAAPYGYYERYWRRDTFDEDFL